MAEPSAGTERYHVNPDTGQPNKCLDGDTCEIHGVGFAGIKGFCGGFGRRALGPWGEETCVDRNSNGEPCGLAYCALPVCSDAAPVEPGVPPGCWPGGDLRSDPCADGCQGMCGDDCESYCNLLEQACPDEYASVADCESSCAGLTDVAGTVVKDILV